MRCSSTLPPALRWISAGARAALRFSFLALTAVAAGSALTALPAQADVSLPGVFGDNMVLQQGVKVPVWGWAEPGEEVTVTFRDKTAKATADKDGKWRVDLDALQPLAEGEPFAVQGKNALKFNNVVVGDVWVCSGQSNMQWSLSASHNGKEEAASAKDDLLRVYMVPNKPSFVPLRDNPGKWQLCSPTSIGGFSGVGYFFGKELRKMLGATTPVGLIGTYVGGTPAQAWTSYEGLKNGPGLEPYVTAYENQLNDLSRAQKNYIRKLPDYVAELKTWSEGAGKNYAETLARWEAEAASAKKEGQPLPPLPGPALPEPARTMLPEAKSNMPGSLYNGMVAPIIPYAIKGAIWYQGESNAGAAPQYAILFPRMITDWRTRWGLGDFPFLFVQLANFRKRSATPTNAEWPLLREAQLRTLSLPNTGMAVIIDVGTGNDIHPPDKMDVGIRLSLPAKKLAYGKDIVYSGPIYDSMKVEDGKIRLSFKHIGGGLTISTSPWQQPAYPKPSTTELKGFAIAGEDKQFQWAEAKIEGDTIVVSSDKVPKPVAVRYGWDDDPEVNLYNKEGLPASPFRTDNW
ncbi:MAG: sialate O-acetylesterase [Candidatus Methylacidiphilales bacterium]|nr:sialate O-acetylesterase [Candidatus Methylacidiphilales bacterium]